ncbi:MAG: FtsQ-type POTRA domain-containing protein [Pseudomonadota bacterium]
MKRRSTLVNRFDKRKRHRSFYHHRNSNEARRYVARVFTVFYRVGSGMVKLFILVTVITVISVSFLCLYHYLLSSPYLRLQQVEVEGVDGKIRDELIEACGLGSDSSLLDLNLNRLKQQMEGHPWIRSVTLERRFPHALIVQAEKERPLGVVLMDKLYYVNRWGEVFKEVSQSEGVDFPLVTGLDSEESRQREQLRRAVSLMRTLESVGGPWTLNQLSEVNVKEDEVFSLYYKDIGAEIKLIGSQLGGEMDKLGRVARHLKETGVINQVNKIDLSYGDGVVVSFRDGIKGKVSSGG